MSGKYVYTEDMNEISGFGGGYEEACRKMVVAGCEWFDQNPAADPQFTGYEGIFGIITEDDEDAKALTKAIVAVAASFGCTGAMHQATISHIMFIRKNGWDVYVEEMSKPEKEEDDASV